MGQVSILEDLQTALENLQALSGSSSTAPTEIQIAAQRKYLQRERERISEVSRKLIELTNLMRDNLSKDGRLLDILEVERGYKNLSALKEERAKLSEELKRLRKDRDCRKQQKKELLNLADKVNQLEVERAALEVKVGLLSADWSQKSTDQKSIRSELLELVRMKAKNVMKLSKEEELEEIGSLKQELEKRNEENRALSAKCKRLDSKVSELRELLARKTDKGTS